MRIKSLRFVLLLGEVLRDSTSECGLSSANNSLVSKPISVLSHLKGDHMIKWTSSICLVHLCKNFMQNFMQIFYTLNILCKYFATCKEVNISWPMAKGKTALPFSGYYIHYAETNYEAALICLDRQLNDMKCVLTLFFNTARAKLLASIDIFHFRMKTT